jgi:aryl-alcohol dehydrogenase-like predicted oxidoreductase
MMKTTRRHFTRAGLAAGALGALGVPVSFASPEPLIRKVIPASGEKIPVVGLGTNRYGVDGTEAARAPLRAALKRFEELGGTLIDTAPMYRSSESVLGDLMAELGNRDKLFIATKTDKHGGPEATQAQLEESQQKLRTTSFELMQVHNLIGWRETLPVLHEWKQEGLIRYVGITTSRSDQYGDFEAVIKNEALDFIQVNYSLEQQESADRLLPLAADRGMAVIINRAFGGGRIFDAVGDQSLPDWANAFGCESWAQFLLKYAISHPAATVAIPGMTKARHVEDNMHAARGRLPDASERQRREDFFASL